MVLRPESISQRLKELDEILQELNKYRAMDQESLRKDLSQRWVIERGLIAAAAMIIDIIVSSWLKIRLFPPPSQDFHVQPDGQACCGRFVVDLLRHPLQPVRTPVCLI